MDVALDANVILNDPRMHGNAFHNLLAYLKKTDSRLVLSKVVFDEALARYPDRLRSAAHKAAGAVGSLRNLLFDGKIRFPEIDVPQETKKLKQKLLRPSPNVRRSLIVKNFTKIKMEEVAKRGIDRIPPANGAGEELRDVMHWLMILAHAQNSSREIAFISEDEHFRKEKELHPRLRQDISDSKANLHFYISIDEFIKAHAPKPRDLSETEAFGLYSKVFAMDRFEIEARKFFPRRWPTASSIGIDNREISLLHGALYDVTPHSQFGELEFQGKLSVRVESNLSIINSVIWNYDPEPSQIGPSIPGLLWSSPASYSPSFFSPDSLSIEVPTDPTPVVAAAFTKPIPTPVYRSTPTVTHYEVSAKIVISIRIVNGKVTQIETERFQLTEITKTT